MKFTIKLWLRDVHNTNGILILEVSLLELQIIEPIPHQKKNLQNPLIYPPSKKA